MTTKRVIYQGSTYEISFRNKDYGTKYYKVTLISGSWLENKEDLITICDSGLSGKIENLPVAGHFGGKVRSGFGDMAEVAVYID